ncbi:MAG: hypothetical protein KDA93_02850 [Planctomycetaceae bacterium]|nr:hypothetical protein [Planctomycetaceae bacterium]
MRIPTWIAALSSILLLLAAGETSAQSPDHSVTPASFEDALTGRVSLTSFAEIGQPPEADKPQIRGQSTPYAYPPGAGGFHPAYGNNNPGAIWPANTPHSFQPSPGISPYYPPNVSKQQTYNRDGLWFKEILHRKRDYFFTTEYLYTNYRGPGNATIGETPLPLVPAGLGFVNNTGANAGATAGATGGNSIVGFPISNFGLGGAPANFGLGAGGFAGLQRVPVGPGIIPFAILPDAAPLDDATYETTPGAFPTRNMTIFEDVNAHGIRGRFGFMDERGTGVMLTGFWAGLGQENVEYGYTNWNGIPITQDLILANSAGGDVPVSALYGSVPLEFAEGFDAVPVGGETLNQYTGNAQKFDTFFQVMTQTSAFGGNLNLYHEPIYKRKWVSLRPTYGARYLYMDDRFAFRGIDSGLSYTINGAAAGGGGAANQGGNTNVGATFRPTTATSPTGVGLNPGDLFLDANLKSNVDSHMAGPEAGLRYDFGQSKNFSIWGQSTFGLLANHEQVRISGRNIGDPVSFYLDTLLSPNGPDNFLVDDPTDPDDLFDEGFDNRESHTHASPLFEQSVFVQANVLKHVPVINKFHIFESAQFQAGYTLTVIGNVARAGDSIRWKAFPDEPHPDIDYQTWSMQNWSLAVNWIF